MAQILHQPCLLLKTPVPVLQIPCCYKKVKFYDQKLKLGRKLCCCCCCCCRGLDFVGSHEGLFIFAFSNAQPTSPGLCTLGFLGDACSKQVLMWGEQSPGWSKAMGANFPLMPLRVFMAISEWDICMGEQMHFIAWDRSWVFGLKLSRNVSNVSVQKHKLVPPLSLPLKSGSDGWWFRWNLCSTPAACWLGSARGLLFFAISHFTCDTCVFPLIPPSPAKKKNRWKSEKCFKKVLPCWVSYSEP